MASALGLAAWLGLLAVRPAQTPPLAREGRALATVVLAATASPAERTAAEELALYLNRITGARFEVATEGPHWPRGPALHVGPTRLARHLGIRQEALGPEEWIVRRAGPNLLLCGGRPRGTLYAVYRLLDAHLGVRWWTPRDETVPKDAEPLPAAIDERGAPRFVYRDVFGTEGPREFLARNRLNGHYARLGPERGGTLSYGPPKQVHNFYLYVPPERYFESHPEFYSEVGGLRYAEGAQLCLTNPELQLLVRDALLRQVDAAEQRARRSGATPPSMYAFSQNDWGRPCDCGACRALGQREGSRSAPLVAFVNGLAEAVAERHPGVLIDTLAYGWSFAPPRTLTARDNVVVRLSGLYQRDFSKPLSHPVHAEYRAAVQGWAARTRHLRIWDYAVTYGDQGDLPRPGPSGLGDELRWYHEQGVEGLFVQFDPPIDADMRDLKLWVLLKLLEDPRRDSGELTREFCHGFYGAAGPHVLRYRELLEEAAAARPATIRFDAGAERYDYLDAPFLLAAHGEFDRAESAVAGDALLLRRLRHARLALDGATLQRWERVFPGDRAAPDPRVVLRRYRAAWDEQIELRLPPDARAEAREELELRLADLAPRLERNGAEQVE